MDPRNSLREEHGAIMKMLAVLQKFFAKPIDLKGGDAKDLEALIKFFEIYVDRYHHGKEEQHLFPALSRARTPNIDSLINSLIDDHRQAREDMRQIKSHAVHPSAGVDSNEPGEGVQHYVDLVRKHIRIENSGLLPLIEEVLSGTERLQMAGEFLDLEDAILGSGGSQTFLESVRTLYQKYSLQ